MRELERIGRGGIKWSLCIGLLSLCLVQGEERNYEPGNGSLVKLSLV